MMPKLHSLLKRQLKKHFTCADDLQMETQRFIAAVNDACMQSDDDRNMLERSLELSSDEGFFRHRDPPADQIRTPGMATSFCTSP
jgi:hypothetical protein